MKYIWFFFLYGFLGWCTEVIFATCVRGRFENRGFLNGPICPIYGIGLTTCIFFLEPIKDNFIILFAGSVVVTSMIELIAGWLMEKMFHHRWWDYSDMPLNLGGYICLAFSIIWGLGCVLFIDVIHPSIGRTIESIPPLASKIILPILGVCFVVDTIATAETVFKFNRRLESIDRLAADIHKGSDMIGEKLYEATTKIKEDEKTQKLVNEVKAKKEEFKGEKDAFQLSWQERRILKAFPNMKSERYHDALAKLRSKIKK